MTNHPAREIEPAHLETPDGRLSIYRRQAHPALRHYVYDYRGYVNSLLRPIRRRQLPVLYVPIIINFGRAFRVVDRHGGDDRPLGSFVAGLHGSFVLVDSVDDELCLHVDLTPLGAHRLFGLPMADLTDQTVELADLPGGVLPRLVDELGNSPDWPARFARMDRFLLSRLGNTREDSAVAWAWSRLVASKGQEAVGDIARELGWSHKRLGNRFREQIGLTPKKAGRLMRFNHALDWYQASAARPADVAAACGYADQAHMSHEFKAFSGLTPQALFSAEIGPDSGVVDRSV